MKRLLLCLLLLMLPCAALANSWGASGGTPEIVEGNHDNDYTGIAEMPTKALYQPGHEKADKVRLERTADGFSLVYPDEEYRFVKSNGEWELHWAAANGLIFSREAAGELLVIDGETTVIWQMGVYGEENAAMTLGDFNIALFPRSTEEVRRLNALRAVVAGGGEMLWNPVAESEDKTLPVYGTFFPAAVRTTGETWLTEDPGVSQHHQMVIPVGAELNALDCYGLFYAYVETELEGQRIRGFVPLRDLELMPADGAADMADGLVGAWRGPDMGFAQNYIAFGEIGLFATYEEADDRLMDRDRGSWEVRACAPERFNNDSTLALLLTYDNGRAVYVGIAPRGDTVTVCTEASFDWTRVRPETWETEWDLMAQVAGDYEIFAGGSMLAGDSFTLHANGTMATHDDPACIGTWAITRYNPAEGYIWNCPAYTVTVALDNGYTCRRGMTYGALDGGEQRGYLLTLSDGEGSGGYIRTDVDPAGMAAIAGNYAFTDGDILLPGDELRLHEEGYFFSAGSPEGEMRGIWALRPCEGALFGRQADFEITVEVSDHSAVQAGESLRFGGAFTPEAGGNPPVLTLFTEGGSATYTWEEPAGNG